MTVNHHSLPTLPSAKPPRTSVIGLLGISALLVIAGIGLSASAIGLYLERAHHRVGQTEALAQLEREAQRRQRAAQLKRNLSAPHWISNATYEPDVEYQLSGVSKTEVPVLLGHEWDTAVCIGTMGPEGFKQDVNHPLCLGY